ncbi:MAG TPA: hypothetical protein H9871_01480 [Candidatus Nesterenkonia stercoripullorum]|uniref:Transmembrane protein n=1 Tax=Candidatus Nesterenkonia stercoripullorum TaxID=2838701 RepID=A0A9D1S1E0_9MICC|nr:hypothetical protein [Candidatus Nesterenkonia stercoripullorum]
MGSDKRQDGAAVRHFIGAAFAFSSTTLFFDAAPIWVAVMMTALGLCLLVTGGIRFSSEVKQRRRAKGP